jgi:hypothetical protein
MRVPEARADSALLDVDPHAGRRYALAYALALALTALGLGLVRWHAVDDREPRPVAITLERVPTPPPTPAPTAAPTPPPTPAPRVERVTPAPVPQRAAPHRSVVAPGSRPAPAPAIAAPVVALAVSPAPSAAAPAAAAPMAGAGPGGAAGSGSGTGPGAGSGAPAGSGGNGTGAVNADIPCGYVEFAPDDVPRVVRGTAYERIRATVHFRDGHTEAAVFPYAWIYPNAEQSDPWSDTNTRLHPDARVPLQFPPAGTDTRRFSPLIRYILDHTQPSGTTVLEECATLRP